MSDPLNLMVLGSPLCGKGTQAELISKEFDIDVVSTGQIFRDAINQNSDLGKKVRDIVYAGRLVPDQIVFRALRPCLGVSRFNRGLILDGFPRTIGQMNFLENLSSRKKIKLKTAILLQINKEEMFKRSVGRKRLDDNDPEVLETRWRVYQKETMPVISWYRNEGRLLEIDGIGPISEVWVRVYSQIKKNLR